EAEAAGFAAVAALLVAADRQFGGAVQYVVDPAAAGADAADGLEGLADVLAPDAGGEPVGGVVGDGDRLFRRLEGERRQHRPEDLFAGNAHPRRGAVEDGRGVVEALVAE